jgi:hypothetical protein
MQRLLKLDPQFVNRNQQYYERFCGGFWLSKWLLPPIYDACGAFHFKCVKFLIDNLADIHRPSGRPLLETLYEYDAYEREEDSRVAILEYLLTKGLSPDVKLQGFCEPDSCTVLEYAANKGFERDVELLLQHGASTKCIVSVFRENIIVQPIKRLFCEFKLKIAKLFLLYGATLAFEFESNDGFWLPLPHMLAIKMFAAVKGPNPSKTVDLASANFLEALKLYRAFGGNLSAMKRKKGSCTKEGRETILEFVVGSCEEPMEKELQAKVLPSLTEMIENPMCLKSLARLAIRKSKGRCYLKYVEKSHVPLEVKSLMKFEDIKITEPVKFSRQQAHCSKMQ